jgi:hypothetical protein
MIPIQVVAPAVSRRMPVACSMRPPFQVAFLPSCTHRVHVAGVFWGVGVNCERLPLLPVAAVRKFLDDSSKNGTLNLRFEGSRPSQFACVNGCRRITLCSRCPITAPSHCVAEFVLSTRTSPPFITQRTLCTATLISASGSPDTATKSA